VAGLVNLLLPRADFYGSPLMVDIALQHAVQAVLDELVEDGDEVGLQAAVIRDGALVADAHNGVADPVSGEPVSAGTLFFAGSTAKGVGRAHSRSGSTFGMVGTNGSAAYADIDTGVAIALMRNRFAPDFTAIARLDDIVAKAYPPPANPEDRNP
jgi:CubicO group peptidase (beta-lactamase class C family)